MLTLAEVAFLADATPKWVLNTCAALEIGGPYSLGMAWRLLVIRLLQTGAGFSVGRADAVTERLGEAAHGAVNVDVVSVPLHDQGTLTLQLDVARLRSAFATRRSALQTSVAPRVRGRPKTRSPDPIEAAIEWGLDISLLQSNLRRTPSERLRQLDAMADFSRRVRRPHTRPGG